MEMSEISTFEDEILGLNPEYDLVFSKYNEQSRNDSPHALEPNRRRSSPHKMKIISKMNEIINAKPVGELPTQHDWDEQHSAEMETITLMRKLGLEQSVDRAPDEKRTISTVPTSEDVIFMKNGRKKMSIFMADAYFELKPKSEPSFDLEDDDAAPEETTTSDFSDDVNLYQPIFESSEETESTSLSEDPVEKSVSSKVHHGLSSHPGKRKSNELPLKSSNQQNVDRSYTRDDSQSFSTCRSSTSSNRSSRSWRSLNGSFSDARDENNWRLNVCKAKEPENQNLNKDPEQHILNRTVTISKESSKPRNVDSEESLMSTRALYKPKDLFMKKKAMMIQQVLAEYQS